MPDFEKMYYQTFNSDTDVIQALEDITARMKETQQQTEHIYIETADDIEDEFAQTPKETPIAN